MEVTKVQQDQIKYIEMYIDNLSMSLKAKLVKTILEGNCGPLDDLRGDMTYKLWRAGAWYSEFKA